MPAKIRQEVRIATETSDLLTNKRYEQIRFSLPSSKTLVLSCCLRFILSFCNHNFITSSNSSGRYNQVSEKGRYTPGHSFSELSPEYSDGPVHMNVNMPKVDFFADA